MKVKVFQPNSYGKIEFTRAELEKLLNEVYDGGFRDGEIAQREKTAWTWTSPYRYSDTITLTGGTNCPNSIDNRTQPIDKLTCTCDSADASVAKNSTADIAPVSIALGNMDRETARKHISDTVAALRRAQAAPGDVFTNLAKELNF